MPLERIYTAPECIWGFWKIIEDESALAAVVPLETVSDTIVNRLKRLEFLSGRALIQTLLKSWDLDYPGMTKDSFGKPFLNDSSIQISISHSYPYVAAILHRHKKVGIDLEQPKDKLLRIAHRVLAEDELKDAGDDVIKHCIYWSAKESLVKIYGKKDLIFAKHLLITPFPRGAEGHLIGRILANNSETTVPLRYIVYDNFVVVVSN